MAVAENILVSEMLVYTSVNSISINPNDQCIVKSYSYSRYILNTVSVVQNTTKMIKIYAMSHHVNHVFIFTG